MNEFIPTKSLILVPFARNRFVREVSYANTFACTTTTIGILVARVTNPFTPPEIGKNTREAFMDSRESCARKTAASIFDATN